MTDYKDLIDCPICELRGELDMRREAERVEKIDIGLSYLTDVEGTLPIKISFYSKPTKEQWRKLLDICMEIDKSQPPEDE